MDIGVRLQRQWIKCEANNLIGSRHHLGFSNPQSCLGNRTGEIVYLDAIELIDRDLDGICEFTDYTVAAEDNLQGLVFQTSERRVGFGQEVAGAAGRVKEFQLGNLILEGISPVFLGLGNGCSLNVGQLCLKVVQEEWIYYLVDVLDAGVVHTAGATCLRVQCALEYGTKDGR